MLRIQWKLIVGNQLATKPSFASMVQTNLSTLAYCGDDEDILDQIDDQLHDLEIHAREENTSSIPTISISPETRKRISSPWAQCLIGKVMGRNVGYKFLKERKFSLWKPCGHLQILDLGKNFFLFKLSYVNDLRRVVYQGPWFVGGHFLSLQRWSPVFKPSNASLERLIVWIRVPELPIEFFDKEILGRGRNLKEGEVLTSKTL